jgi:hypothetical protein
MHLLLASLALALLCGCVNPKIVIQQDKGCCLVSITGNSVVTKPLELRTP